MTYKITFSMKAAKDYKELERQGYKEKVDSILMEISVSPRSSSKRLKGRYSNLYSDRLNAVDRIVYSIEDSPFEQYEDVINVLRMRTHYEGILPSFLF